MENISTRNFIGAFLGGCSGIIACGWTPYLLPVGVLLGCTLGFMYQELPHIIIGTCLKSYWFVKTTIPQKAITFLPLKMPHFIRVLQEHPINQANAIRNILVGCNSACLLILIIIPATINTCYHLWTSSKTTDDTWQPWLSMYLILVAALALCCNMENFPLITRRRYTRTENKHDVRDFYKRWEHYAASPLRYALRDALHVLQWDLIGALLSIPVFIIGVIVFLLVILALLTNMIAYVVTTAKPWFCITVTLFVTYYSAWVFPPAEYPKHAQWLVALTTGLTAGMSTLGTTYLLTRFVINHPWYKWLQQASVLNWIDPEGVTA